MALVKKATGKIKKIKTQKAEDTLQDLNLEWSDVMIKDVLIVPTGPQSVDLDLNADDDDDIIAKPC